MLLIVLFEAPNEELIVSVNWHKFLEITQHFLVLTVRARLDEVFDNFLTFFVYLVHNVYNYIVAR
jgi:hypothetical protein